MNIIISGWPAAGTTSLSLLVAHTLGLRYVYAGGLLKHLAQHLFAGEEDAQMLFERQYGAAWDALWEGYVKEQLVSSDNLLLEGKTAGFLYHGSNLFKVMVICDATERARRAAGDGRPLAAETIAARDKEVRERWIKLFGFDSYDPDTIKTNFQLVLDTTSMTIAEELEKVITAYVTHANTHENYTDRSRQALQTLTDEGKQGLQQLLIKNGNLIANEEVITAWKATPGFAEDVLGRAILEKM